jgi:exodeoxyribonuclease VII large subunit
METIKVLVIGDTVGKPGRQACQRLIPKLKDKYGIDFVVVNGENIASGSSITRDSVDEVFSSGVDVMTSGDHIFRKKEAAAIAEENHHILRPLNYPKEVPGHGFVVATTLGGIKVAVVNLLGRVFLQTVDCPFQSIETALKTIKSQTKVILVDFHAEATSEKVAMGWFLDGQVSAIYGTHTHIQTADETILPKGTAYMTDLGMSGPYRSVIGRDIDQVLFRFRTQMPGPMEVATEDARLSGALIEINIETGKAKSIKSLTEPAELNRETTQKIYTVSELTRGIRSLLESEFPAIWVEGEISNFKHHSSGHMYFTLKDEAAQISAVFFARANQFLKFDLENGQKVIAIGRISVYDQRGQYQIYVQRLEPKGIGALQLQFLQLKERLEKEGLFSEERKKPVPLYPKRIGLVTSPTGAAIQDMLKIFKARKYGLQLFLVPVKVQGDGAGLEIAGAIDQLSQLDEPLDVIIAGRGGGSLEDLWAFNEEIVARAIARSKIPVISAVGHEIDWTIADFVADLRCHTPTAAAEQAVMKWDELEDGLRETRERMQNAIRNLMESRREALINLKESYAFKQPKVYIEQILQRVDEFSRQMQNYLMRIFEEQKQLFSNRVGKLEALSPLGILERGYSITFDQKGHLVKEVNQVRIGDSIRTRLKSAVVKSKITEVEKTHGI